MKTIRSQFLGFVLCSALLFSGHPAQAALDFSDANSIPEYARFAIHALNHLKIVNGNSDGTFKPNTSINRAEFAKIMVTATGVDQYFPLTSTFPDVTRNDWFYPFVETARNQGWIEGYSDGSFRPGGQINRAEIAKILTKAFNVQIPISDGEWYDGYFDALESADLLPNNTQRNTIDAGVAPSRAEVMEQLYRFMRLSGKITPDDIADMPELPAIQKSGSGSTSDSNSNSETDPQTSVSGLQQTVDSGAGTLNVSMIKNSAQKITVRKSQASIPALNLKMNATSGNVKVEALQIRRIGNGSARDFGKAWIEIDGKALTPEVSIDEDVFVLKFYTPLYVTSATKTLTLKVNTAPNAQSGSSSRFVLYLPEWIQSNTTNKVGFFPFGGVDIEVQ